MSIANKIKNRTKWLLSYSTNWYYITFFKEPIVKNIEETILELVHSNRSIARYGDGELDLITGKDIPFQKNDVGLVERLKNILIFLIIMRLK